MTHKILAPHPERFSFNDSFFGNPEFAEDCYVSQSAIVIGHVIVQSEVIICPLSSVRADEGVNFMIGKGTNIQDHCCLHGHKGKFVKGDDGQEYSIWIGNHCTFAHGSKGHGPLKIGKKTFIGFNAILHGSEIGRNCFIDHGVVIKNSVIGNNCHISAGAIVEGVKIDHKRLIGHGVVVICQAQADALPMISKEIAEKDSATNQMIVDENKHLCEQYHKRRVELIEHEKNNGNGKIPSKCD